VTAIQQALKAWSETLCTSVSVGGLLARNPTAHKWKAPFRCLLLREAVCWRVHDLLQQSFMLREHSHVLGSRILLRSAIESLGILIYSNQLMRAVVTGTEDFHRFSDKTSQLLLGSKDGSTDHSAINILTVLEKCERRFPSIRKHYGALSESAHPNFEGVCLGYSRADREEYVTSFANRWMALYGDTQTEGIGMCIEMFLFEYNEEWPEAFQALESWIAENDAMLERTKQPAS
jgi:hypothetical protein